MKIKLLVCDLDETLINSEGLIDEGNLNIIKKLNEGGVRVVLCSGRPYVAMKKYSSVVEKIRGLEYTISYNGALIHDEKGKVIYSTEVNAKTTKSLIDISKKTGISIQLYKDGIVYVNKINKYVKRYINRAVMPAKEIEDLTVIGSSYKVLFNYKFCEKFNNLKESLIEEFKDLNIFYSEPGHIEIINSLSSKGNAVKHLADILGIEREDIICIGDGYNDITMLEYAGCGIAMANAPDEVKEKANYVSERNNNENVLEEIYKKFIKIDN